MALHVREKTYQAFPEAAVWTFGRVSDGAERFILFGSSTEHTWPLPTARRRNAVGFFSADRLQASQRFREIAKSQRHCIAGSDSLLIRQRQARAHRAKRHDDMLLLHQRPESRVFPVESQVIRWEIPLRRHGAFIYNRAAAADHGRFA